MKVSLLFLLLLVVSTAHADTKLGIKTVAGQVNFIVGDHWPVLEAKTKDPVPLMVFQIPNTADTGTHDSTVLVLKLYYLNTDQGRAAFDKPPKQFGPTPPKEDRFGKWVLYRQFDPTNEVMYTVLDARNGSVADVAVGVRLAWPHLKNNQPKYDEDMVEVFKTFLTSVHGEMGISPKKEGEVWRRPTQ